MTSHRLTALAAAVKVGPAVIAALVATAWLAGKWLEHDTEKGCRR